MTKQNKLCNNMKTKKWWNISQKSVVDTAKSKNKSTNASIVRKLLWIKNPRILGNKFKKNTQVKLVKFMQSVIQK